MINGPGIPVSISSTHSGGHVTSSGPSHSLWPLLSMIGEDSGSEIMIGLAIPEGTARQPCRTGI